MHKRARNHALKIERDIAYKQALRNNYNQFKHSLFAMFTYKFYEEYEPQGKRLN